MLPACLPDGSSVKREFQALFCEKPEVQSLRLTLPIYARLHHSGDLCQSCQFATHRYAYRRLRQFDPAMQHCRQALALNPRHRSAHEHLGEAHLVRGDLAKAKEQLAALEQICLIPCDEYDDLKRAIAEYDKVANR